MTHHEPLSSLDLIASPAAEPGPFSERRSGTDRRICVGRRMDDYGLDRLYTDVQSMRDEIKLISQAIQKLAVHEERVSALTTSLGELRTDIQVLEKRQDRLRENHDQCPISSFSKDIEWLKWFVMANTVAIFGVVLGTIIHFIRGVQP